MKQSINRYMVRMVNRHRVGALKRVGYTRLEWWTRSGTNEIQDPSVGAHGLDPELGL